MSAPKVSIAIPTKNRAFLIDACIRCALDQSYPNIEVIIADNDDTAATSEVVSTFTDPRVKHFKTGGLSMPDNWERAYQLTSGDIIMMLEDKQLLKHHAVETVLRYLQDPAVDVVTWASDSFDDLGRFKRVWSPPSGRRTEILTGDEVIERFLKGSSSDWSHYLPIAHLSAVRRTLAEKVQASVTGRQFLPMSPDYTSAFQWIAYGGMVACLGEPLVVFATKKHSNGQAALLKQPLYQSFLEEMKMTDSDRYDRIPVKAMTVPGAIYNDFLHLREQIGGRLAMHDIDMPRFYLAVHAYISSAHKLGTPMHVELEAWQAALDAEPAPVRQKVLSKIKPLRLSNRLSRSAKKAEVFVKGVWKTWVRRLPEWNYANAVDYIAAQKNHFSQLSRHD
jgi:Glycosyl transferase family 2